MQNLHQKLSLTHLPLPLPLPLTTTALPSNHFLNQYSFEFSFKQHSLPYVSLGMPPLALPSVSPSAFFFGSCRLSIEYPDRMGLGTFP